MVYRMIVFGLRGGYKGQLIDCLSQESVIKTVALSTTVWHEIHHFYGFLRFQELASGILYAKIKPKANLLKFLGDHFADRFPLENFMIYDEAHDCWLMHEAGKEWFTVAGDLVQTDGLLTFSSDEWMIQELFCHFVNKIAIKERENLMPQTADTPAVRGGWFYRFLKRTSDFTVAALALVVLAIPMLVIALWIRLDSKGPAIFRQERLGKGGKPFTMYKFRSMRLDAEADGPQWAQRDDDRCTKLGQKLRKTRVDELPQLFNILLFNSTEGIVDCSTNISSFRAYIDPMRAFRNLEGMVLRKCSKLFVTTGNIQCFLCLFVIHIRNALEEQKRYNIFLIVLGRNYTIENICAFSQIRFQVSLCHFTH